MTAFGSFPLPTETKILPCPFCGRSPVINTETNFETKELQGWLRCDHGRSEGEGPRMAPIYTIIHIPPQGAIEAWNTRRQKRGGDE